MARRPDFSNLFLQYAVDLGLIGFSLWLLATMSGLPGRHPWSRTRPGLELWPAGLKAMLVAWVVMGLTAPTDYIFSTLVLWTWAGVIYGARLFALPLRGEGRPCSLRNETARNPRSHLPEIVFTGGDAHEYVEPAMLERIGTIAAGLRILDIGCGGGRFAGRLSALGATVVGIDPNANRIAAARADHPEIRFEQLGASPDLFELSARGAVRLGREHRGAGAPLRPGVSA